MAGGETMTGRGLTTSLALVSTDSIVLVSELELDVGKRDS